MDRMYLISHRLVSSRAHPSLEANRNYFVDKNRDLARRRRILKIRKLGSNQAAISNHRRGTLLENAVEALSQQRYTPFCYCIHLYESQKMDTLIPNDQQIRI